MQSFVDSVNEGLNKFTNDKKDNILILFTAHSLPLKVFICFIYIASTN